MYKFLRDIIFADNQIQWFIFEDHLLSTLVLHIHCKYLKNFEDIIFMEDKLLVKTVKIMSFKTLHVYGIS